MKRIFTMVSTVLLAASAVFAAGTGYRSIAVKHADHHLSVITIESGMTTKTSDGNLELSSDKGAITIPLSDVRNWTFSTEEGSSDKWASIGGVSEDSAVTIQLQEGCITLGNLPEGSSVSLTAINGVGVAAANSVSGEYTIPTDTLTKGIYILTVNNRSFKVALSR